MSTTLVSIPDHTALHRHFMQFLRETCWYKHAGNNDSGEVAYLALGLAGETGEFVDEIKKIVRETGFDDPEAFRKKVSHQFTRIDLAKELGDIEWYMTRIQDVLGLCREDVLLLNTYKLYQRLITKGMDIEWPYTNIGLSLADTEQYLIDLMLLEATYAPEDT